MLPIWTKLLETTKFVYNPIDNYDRKETYTDTRTINRVKDNTDSYSSQDTGTLKDTNDGYDNDEIDFTPGKTTEQTTTVSAENDSDYQPDEQVVSTESGKEKTEDNRNFHNTLDRKTSGDTTASATGKENEVTSEGFSHDYHAHGNIGVTTTQTMIKQEREIVDYSIYERIRADFVDRFCLWIW